MDTERQPNEYRKLVVAGSVNSEERATVEATSVRAGYKRLSPFVRDVLLAVSRSDEALNTVLAVAGKRERRAA
jgi:hypothetical protein